MLAKHRTAGERGARRCDVQARVFKLNHSSLTIEPFSNAGTSPCTLCLFSQLLEEQEQCTTSCVCTAAVNRKQLACRTSTVHLCSLYRQPCLRLGGTYSIWLQLPKSMCMCRRSNADIQQSMKTDVPKATHGHHIDPACEPASRDGSLGKEAQLVLCAEAVTMNSMCWQQHPG